jgi:hypothetical protein
VSSTRATSTLMRLMSCLEKTELDARLLSQLPYTVSIFLNFEPLFPDNPIKRMTGKFSIRLVPDMTTAKTTELVLDYVNKEFAKINTKNKMNVELLHGGEPWVADPNVSCNLDDGNGVLTDIPTFSTTTTEPLTRLPNLFTELLPTTPGKEVSSNRRLRYMLSA